MDDSLLGYIIKRLRTYCEIARATHEREYKNPAFHRPVASRIWRAEPDQSPFSVAATFQACAMLNPEDRFHRVDEHISIYDPESKKNETLNKTTMHLSSSFREAVFHVAQYDKRMQSYGLKPVMGAESNLLPNIYSTMEDMRHRYQPLLEWPGNMACMGVYNNYKFRGDHLEALPTTMRLRDASFN